MKNKTPLELVTSYLQEQKKYYDMLLLKLADQKKAIDHTDEARLMAIIDEKSGLIAAAQKLEEKIGEVFKGVAESERDNLIQKTGILRGQIEGALKQLVALETSCAEILNIERLHAQEQIKELQQRKNAFKGYGKPDDDTSWFSKKA